MYLLEMEDQWQVTCHVLCDLQCFQPLDKIQASFVCVHVHAYVYVHVCVQMCVHVRGRDGGVVTYKRIYGKLASYPQKHARNSDLHFLLELCIGFYV